VRSALACAVAGAGAGAPPSVAMTCVLLLGRGTSASPPAALAMNDARLRLPLTAWPASFLVPRPGIGAPPCDSVALSCLLPPPDGSPAASPSLLSREPLRAYTGEPSSYSSSYASSKSRIVSSSQSSHDSDASPPLPCADAPSHSRQHTPAVTVYSTAVW
jgi:hypothetical protein